MTAEVAKIRSELADREFYGLANDRIAYLLDAVGVLLEKAQQAEERVSVLTDALEQIASWGNGDRVAAGTYAKGVLYDQFAGGVPSASRGRGGGVGREHPNKVAGSNPDAPSAALAPEALPARSVREETP